MYRRAAKATSKRIRRINGGSGEYRKKSMTIVR
jgi:hypothetical protein